ncbi:putative salivary secreted peptide [Eufriesea mexicana]|uniref:probable salivary secreted peptide n=1 Tax=Eufriesea mexicana TaxID=516756 RepID=UPI00083C295E|nr:PREDICTED: probable salivary secreted peptide [Eufriesea mexicana]OAD58688.1 putative salivary secreted peptide [Eufriesea mexicana]
MSGPSVLLYLAIAAIFVFNAQVSSVPQVGPYAANNSNKSHDLIVGFRMPGDRLVLRQSVVKKSAFWQIVSDEMTFNTSRWERITMVRILDQKTDGTGAYASLLRGGPGYQNVTLRFKSQRNHGIHFIVELYSRP